MSIMLKTIQPYFNEIWYGVKKAELRFNDRDYHVNQFLYLREYDPVKDVYSGRAVYVQICHVLYNYPLALKKGYCMFSFTVLKRIDAYVSE